MRQNLYSLWGLQGALIGTESQKVHVMYVLFVVDFFATLGIYVLLVHVS